MLCAPAFHEGNDLEGVLRDLKTAENDALDLCRPARTLFNILLDFVESLGDVAHDHVALRVQVRKFVKHPQHWILTHILLLKYMIQLTLQSKVSVSAFIVYVHDVSCNLSLANTHIIDKQKEILSVFEKASTADVIASEICFLTSILVDCAEVICREQVTRILSNMYNRCKGDAMIHELKHITFLLSHPVVVSSMFFHTDTRRQICSSITFILRHTELNVLMQDTFLPNLVEVLTRYMQLGAYETNMILLELGRLLEEKPYPLLVEKFVTSSPKFPFPASTWNILEPFRSDPVVKRCFQYYTSLVCNDKQQMVKVDNVRVGEWFCRPNKDAL